MSGIPGLKDIPILKYLFAQERKTTRTNRNHHHADAAHIVRMPNIIEIQHARPLHGLRNDSAPATQPCMFRHRQTTAAAGRAALASRLQQVPPPGAPVNVPPAATPPASRPCLRPRTSNRRMPHSGFAPSPITLSAGRTNDSEYYGEWQRSFAARTSHLLLIPNRSGFGKFETAASSAVTDRSLLSSNESIRRAAPHAFLWIDRRAPPRFRNGKSGYTRSEPGIASSGESVLRVTDFRVRDAQQVVQIGRAAEVRVIVP